MSIFKKLFKAERIKDKILIAAITNNTQELQHLKIKYKKNI
jgi:hypothetical protein